MQISISSQSFSSDECFVRICVLGSRKSLMRLLCKSSYDSRTCTVSYTCHELLILSFFLLKRLHNDSVYLSHVSPPVDPERLVTATISHQFYASGTGFRYGSASSRHPRPPLSGHAFIYLAEDWCLVTDAHKKRLRSAEARTHLVSRTRLIWAIEPSVQMDLESGTMCRQISDSPTCHTSVSDSR